MKLKINYYINIALLTILLVLVGCKVQKQDKMISNKLISQDYVLTHLGDEVVEDSVLTLKVDTDKSIISGYSGCNSYSFNYKLDKEELDLGYAAATKMYCEDSMKLENLFFQKAASVLYFENSEEALHLKNKKGDIVIKAKKKEKGE